MQWPFSSISAVPDFNVRRGVSASMQRQGEVYAGGMQPGAVYSHSTFVHNHTINRNFMHTFSGLSVGLYDRDRDSEAGCLGPSWKDTYSGEKAAGVFASKTDSHCSGTRVFHEYFPAAGERKFASWRRKAYIVDWRPAAGKKRDGWEGSALSAPSLLSSAAAKC